MKLQLLVDNAKVAVEIKPTTNPKVAIVVFSDGSKCMASVGKHFNGNDPLFLGDDNKLLPGWTINGEWLASPNAAGGVKLADFA